MPKFRVSSEFLGVFLNSPEIQVEKRLLCNLALRTEFVNWKRCDLQTKKTVATAGRSYGGPSEKFVGSFGGLLRSCALTSQKLPLCGNHQTQRIWGQLLRSLLQNHRNFSEVASEVRPAVHTAALHLRSAICDLEHQRMVWLLGLDGPCLATGERVPAAESDRGSRKKFCDHMLELRRFRRKGGSFSR